VKCEKISLYSATAFFKPVVLNWWVATYKWVTIRLGTTRERCKKQIIRLIFEKKEVFIP